MSRQARGDRDPLHQLVAAIVAREEMAAMALLAASPELVQAQVSSGATRRDPAPYFFDSIRHYMYAGDTALHMAAAASHVRIVEELIERQAKIRARNRRGAEPLHYAVDGGPGLATWDQPAQAAIIARLIAAGADPNARDQSGVAPLHRAVRNRCAIAVKALIAGGADPRMPNRNGSTPWTLANQPTGKSGAGSIEAKAEQAAIVRMLHEYSAD
jgi:ankyrin repeat protein